MATELSINGMTCGNCARHVTEAIQSIPEVRSASVSLQKNQAVVQWKSTENIPAVLEAVKKAGFEAKEVAGECHAPMRADWQPALWLGIGVTAFLMAGEWIIQWGSARWFQWISFALAGFVQVFSGGRFYRGAWRQLKNGDSNMDTLVALGSTTAFGYSAWALLSGVGGHLYFMEAAAIITLISFGHWIEARVSEKAGSALKLLLNLAPQTALKISGEQSRDRKGASMVRPAPNADSSRLLTVAAPFKSASALAHQTHSEVPVETLQLGDQILLRPGDRVPVDGTVLEGESTVNESSLTGEPAPVDKKAGAELFAGTVNLNGRLIMSVTATGEETILAHVIAAVQHAQTSRANIQRLGDRISGVFVPVIVVIAVAAGLWWGLAPASAAAVHRELAPFLWHAHPPMGVAAGFIIAAAILIVACPCAMGLATPAAIMAGANAAARRGILIRDGVALEKAGAISAIVFDKTGTLTVGKPEVADVFEMQPAAANARTLAAALARDSAHPLSQAIAVLSSDRIELRNWHEIRGCGLEAEASAVTENAPAPYPTVGGQFPLSHRERAGVRELRTDDDSMSGHGHTTAGAGTRKIRLGSLRWLRELDVELSRAEKFIAEWSDQGASLLGLAADGRLLAVFALRDTLKPRAAEVIMLLQRFGQEIYLVTGDHSRTATGIARQIGIKPRNVLAEMRPDRKAGFVKELQAGGARVAFVGDGINDAPALAQADLGIAVSRASDIAREAADIILLKSEITGVPEALGLARATLRTIKQNLFWAFFYNALGVPLAALGFISPILCAAAMGLSDLIVIGNALRLLRWRK